MSERSLVAATQQQPTMALSDVYSLGEVFSRSGYFTDARDASQAIVKILAGRELGLQPMAAMQGIYIVKGRPAYSAGLISALIKRSGKYDYRIKEITDRVCDMTFFQDGQPCGESKFTIEDAKRAGTQNIDKFPRNMLYARALTNGARWYCPDVFVGGVYTPDELGADVVYSSEGEIINVVSPAPDPVVTPPATATVNRAAQPVAPADAPTPAQRAMLDHYAKAAGTTLDYTGMTRQQAAANIEECKRIVASGSTPTTNGARPKPTLQAREDNLRKLLWEKKFSQDEIEEYVKHATDGADEAERAKRFADTTKALHAGQIQPVRSEEPKPVDDFVDPFEEVVPEPVAESAAAA